MVQSASVQTAELTKEVYQAPSVEWNSLQSNNFNSAQQTRAVPVEQNDKFNEAKLTNSQADEFVKKLNTTLQAFDTHVSLEWNDKLHRSVFRVVDTDTGKVVRQIPSEDLLRLAERISEVLGLLYDKKM